MNQEAVVVIATYNEAETIGRLLEELSEFLVIVVDDDSPDGTAQIAEAYPNARVVVRRGERGIASAYMRGLRTALLSEVSYVIQMDAGGTHDPRDVWPLLLAAKAQKADLLIGSRFIVRPPILSYRTFISLVAARLAQMRGIAVTDATSGFRVWRRSMLEWVTCTDCQARGFAFNLELLMRARLLGASIGEYPIGYRLTNSTFRPWMLWEALCVLGGLR